MKIARIIFVALLLLGWAGFATASDDQPAPKDMSKMGGKELYRNHCKVCHTADSKAGEYTPMSLIMEQWEEFFTSEFTKAHKDVVCPQDDSKKVPDMFDKDMIKKIKKFCVDHAADSEQPMTCG